MTTRPTISADVHNPEAVRKAAASIGLVATTRNGRALKAGSIRRLLNEIAAGEVLLMVHPFEGDGEMRAQAASLRELAATLSILDARRQGLLCGLAGALESAAELRAAQIDAENADATE
jgi:hypothetical protein